MTARDRRLVFGSLIVALLSLSCTAAAKVFLDLPRDGDPAKTAPAPAARTAASINEFDDLPPAAIEALTDRDSVLALLPRDHAGSVDWIAAVEDDVIRPRSRRSGQPATQAYDFGYDLYLGEGESHAYFPHSSHVSRVACASCHPAVSRNRLDTLPLEDVHGGELCGSCHGTVAFPVQSCERCHLEAELPPNRLPPILRGDLIVFRPPSTDSLPDGAVAEPADLDDLYPPAQFEHWYHRIRYECKACHVSLFEMQSGTAGFTEEEAHGARACGACHDGRTGFEITVNECYRCHFEGEPRAGPEVEISQ